VNRTAAGVKAHLHAEDSLIPVKRDLGVLDPGPTSASGILPIIIDVPEHGVVEDVGRRVGSCGRHSGDITIGCFGSCQSSSA
jgi:hypothetical protein